MNCDKCGGWALFYHGYDFIGWRCYNCGKRSAHDEFAEFETFKRCKKKIEQVLKIKCGYCGRDFETTSPLRKLCGSKCSYGIYEARKKERIK